MARLIDADELKHDLEWLESDTPVYLDVMSTIDERTTVDAEPVKHGRWEMKPDPFGVFDEIPVCSECGCTTVMRKKYKFCSNCGAKMDKKEEETEVWNCSNGRKIVAPKGTFDKLYYSEDE